jgi:predicted ATPase
VGDESALNGHHLRIHQPAWPRVCVSEEPGRPPLETLADVLRRRRLLLALDNCEHLIARCLAGLGRVAMDLGALGMSIWAERPVAIRPRHVH